MYVFLYPQISRNTKDTEIEKAKKYIKIQNKKLCMDDFFFRYKNEKKDFI